VSAPYAQRRNLPLPLLTAGQMQEWDRRAIRDLGIPERLLMESAGRAAARIVHSLHPAGSVVAAVGAGNNGGDALVLLRTLRSWGREVIAVRAGAAELSRELLHGWEVPVVELGAADEVFRHASVLVDGILGTGASGAPREPQAVCVRAMNASGRPIVALDGPTGIDLTRGSAEGEAIRASETVTFGAPKRGLLLHPGRVHAGRLFVVETGFPPLEWGPETAEVITRAWAAERRLLLPPDSHKGTAGRLVILAGRPAMGGAAIMCGHAALRAGAGTVRIVSSPLNRIPIQTALPEALFVDREADDLAEVARTAKAMVVGPGMGTDDGSREALATMLHAAKGPILIDADALTILAGDSALRTVVRGERHLLTPHPGEMARLLSVTADEVTADPFAAVEEARDRFGCAILLKGSPTLVAAPARPTLANVTGHSGVGVGGMGDTLAGLAGALLARGNSVYEAAGLAIHHAGRAADRAGRGRPILPRDVAEALPFVLARDDENGDTSAGSPDVLLELPPPE
jgi:ADP-dependent NAD(P)H-hydrate dehydratase / NAD(P)H-hydrate epimerase